MITKKLLKERNFKEAEESPRFKVYAYDFFDFGDADVDLDREGYETLANLCVKVKDQKTGSTYSMTFYDVNTFTEISNYTHTSATYDEPENTDWEDGDTYLTDEDEEPFVEQVETLSGKDLPDDEPTEKETMEILQQIPYTESPSYRRRKNYR